MGCHRMYLVLQMCLGVTAAPPSVPHGGAACNTAENCALGGVCSSGKCVCDPWFTGANCTLLNLQRAKEGNGFDLRGLPTGGGRNWIGWSSWGGHAVHDGEAWVGLFSVMSKGCGLSYYHSNSESVWATSAEVDGPFILADPSNPDSAANIAVAAPSHCTQIKRHPNGEYHLYHIFPGAADNATSPDHQPAAVNCLNSTYFESDNSQSSLSKLPPPPPPPPPHCHGTGCIPQNAQQLFVHTAPTPRGPWEAKGHAIQLQTLNATTNNQYWGGSGGAHGGGGGCLWEYGATQWQGPYTQLPLAHDGNPGDPITHPENEDPAVFVDPRGNFHMLTNVNTGHRRCRSGVACGGHAWSRDGLNWSDTFVGAFGPNGMMRNGTTFQLGYVERPQVAQMTPGSPPLALFVSAGPHYTAGATFTWAQRFCDSVSLAAGRCGFMGGVPWNGPSLPPSPPPLK